MKVYQKNKVFFLISISLLFFSCNDNSTGVIYPPDNFSKVTISEGVWGNVWFWEGDFMPGSPNGKITPVIREIYIYEATLFNSVIQDTSSSSFIREINSDFITKVISDKDGFFQITLPLGKYSFFVKEGSMYFANESDDEGYLMSAEVTSNKVSKRQININYKAYY